MTNKERFFRFVLERAMETNRFWRDVRTLTTIEIKTAAYDALGMTVTEDHTGIRRIMRTDNSRAVIQADIREIKVYCHFSVVDYQNHEAFIPDSTFITFYPYVSQVQHEEDRMSVIMAGNDWLADDFPEEMANITANLVTANLGLNDSQGDTLPNPFSVVETSFTITTKKVCKNAHETILLAVA